MITKKRSMKVWSARRWASEFIVIVAGVIVALGANAMWGDWQDRRAEHAYLDQLRGDLDENLVRLRDAMKLEDTQHAAAGAAYAAVVRGDNISKDSAAAWMVTRRGVYYSDPRLLTGTVTTLISTGDLKLIRNSSLRQSIAGYSTRIQEDREEFNRFVASLQPPFDALREEGFRQHGTIADRAGFAAVVAAVTGRPGVAVQHALDGVLIASEIRSVYLKRMLETTQTLREAL